MPVSRWPDAVTNSWANCGITPSAVAPRQSGWIGTSRQPRTVSPSSAAISSIWVRVLATASSSPGRNAVPTAYARAGGSSKPASVADGAQERVGDLHQDAGAVTGVGLGARGTAVLEVAQGGQGLGHDVVAGLTGQGRDEGHATGVVLVARVVEPLGRRERVLVGHRSISRRRRRTPKDPSGAAWWVQGTTLAQASGSAYQASGGGPDRVSGSWAPWRRPVAAPRPGHRPPRRWAPAAARAPRRTPTPPARAGAAG